MIFTGIISKQPTCLCQSTEIEWIKHHTVITVKTKKKRSNLRLF